MQIASVTQSFILETPFEVTSKNEFGPRNQIDGQNIASDNLHLEIFRWRRVGVDVK
jgi:hypothetical protein